MKKTIALLFILLGSALHAQTQKLSELSSANLLDSKIIYEENGEDIYGYFYLFQKDQTQKEEVLIEYIVLDKNLNKITSGTYLHPIFSNFLVKTSVALQPIIKNGNSLMIATGLVPSVFGTTNNIVFGAYYRKLDLISFKLSEPSSFVDFKKIENFIFSKQTLPNQSSTYPQVFKPTNCNGYILPQALMKKDFVKLYQGETIKFQEFRFYDKDLNEKWVFKYNQDDKDKSFYKYDLIASEGTNLIFCKYLFEKPKDNKPKLSLEVIDSNTGLKKFEANLDDAQNLFAVYDVKLEGNILTVYAATNDPNRREEFKYNKITGYAKMEFDVTTGKELNRNFFKWDALADKFKIDEFGEVKSYGFIEFIDFKATKDGKTIVIGEGYDPGSSSKILDLFVFVFDQKMKLIDYKKVEKVKNKYQNLNASGRTINFIGAFDYMYAQKLPDDGYVFYYTDNEKKGLGGNKHPDWILGIVTYVDGKIDTQKISLKAKEDNIIPLKAKKGYILLRDDNELRLEKINY
jgi:hypothetical protein